MPQTQTDNNIDEDVLESMTTIASVCLKQERGVYPLETVPCYCGASSPRMVAEMDRYGMPCQTNLCQRCGLLYVSPRMTAKAYRAFYELEYRKIYKTEDDQNGLIALQNGETLWNLCEFYDVVPQSVIDLGCGNGGMLRAFVQRGCDCLGIDHDPTAVKAGRAVGLPLQTASAVPTGLKADLVILHHVFEHCLDLSATLSQARQLLTPNGVLYLAVPGIQATPIRGMFQTAHVYHFTADTLEYVMECEGWSALKLDEQIVSLWKPRAARRAQTDTAEWAVRNVWDMLGANPHKIQEPRTYNKFPVKMQRENVQAVLASGIPDFSVIRDRERGHDAVIIGGGPSIDGQIETIKALVASGARVVAIERMASWCHAHGIIPDYVAVMDASEDVPSSLRHIQPGTVCVTATQCGQAVVDALQGHRHVYSYSAPTSSLNLPMLFEQAVHAKQTVLCVGASVTHAAMTIAMALGMTSLHIFGFDCHMTAAPYAHGITGVGVDVPEYLDIDVEGRLFRTTGPYFSFVHQFFHLIDTGCLLGYLKRVQVYGDSLVTAMGAKFIADVNRRGAL
jgi:SAM-dependent methyltransferase